MWERYLTPVTLDEAVQFLAQHQGEARVVAGTTDILLELERGIRSGVTVLIDITRIPGLDEITEDQEGWIHLGPLVTHNHCAGSKLIRKKAHCLAQACWEVGAPQIRNRGTIAGNLITASPANDSITPLMALEAVVSLQSASGSRTVPLKEFYRGVRETVMASDEVMTDIAFKGLGDKEASAFVKLGLRRAQAISVVNVAAVVEQDEGQITSASLTLGAVAPTIIHASQAEEHLKGKTLSSDVIQETAVLASQDASPIDDLRGSAAFRREMVRVCMSRALKSIAGDSPVSILPEQPVMLWGKNGWQVERQDQPIEHSSTAPIETTINGRAFTFSTGQQDTLLNLIREQAGLTGTKEGCAEGECGACTVFMDGVAVMSCLVPAPRAHGAKIVTIEGLSEVDQLHPVQQAFIEAGAVQCGYCTPGFVMSGAKLLEEYPSPTRSEAEQAITGNLCRCTGYYKILDALERAGVADQ
jgi:carbon-monoxide dehydrogenase medium subunit